ncbi:MAG TPA: NADH-quinone oxidoreductase subunit NuoN [Rhizomicrobium sp.]|nr:NADH-quinone oxidoreductase subunit NuoN [Rhizomicrobium sp.]
MTGGADLHVLLPELILVVSGMVLLMIGVFRGDRSLGLISVLSVIAIAASAGAIIGQGDITVSVFKGAFITDGFARFAKLLILLGSAAAVALAQSYLRNEKIAKFEFPILILFATTGMMVMVSAQNLIGFYIGLELQNLSLYVLAAFNRDSARSSESGLKYFVLSALASGILLYGMSLIYGFTGSTEYADIARVVAQPGQNIGLVFGLVFFLAGIVFKISAVPFHMWTPDVYEGAPTPVTAFLAMSPKVAAMSIIVRALLQAFPSAFHEWQQVIVFVSILSMALGAVAAIGQTNIKRLMAYSSIGHMGYVLLGLAAGTSQGVEAVLIYLLIYLVTGAGTFACILAMRRDGEMIETIDDLAGLARTQPKLAFAFAMLMLSLAGIPPLAGFFAKFYVFMAAIDAHLYTLAIIGVVTSVVGAYYYLRIVKIIYFDEPAPAFDRVIGPSLGTVLALASVFTLFFVVGAAPMVTAATAAAKTLIP